MSLTVRTVGAVPTALAALLALTGCGGDGEGDGGGTAVVAPTPDAAAAPVCEAVAAALPERVEGQGRTDDGALAQVAVWGDPGIVLRCGVSLPLLLTPGEEGYDPLADAVDVNGVSWLLEDAPGGGKVFTTTHRTVFVEVTVPAAYAPEVNPLVDLAGAIAGNVPLDELYAEQPPGS